MASTALLVSLLSSTQYEREEEGVVDDDTLSSLPERRGHGQGCICMGSDLWGTGWKTAEGSYQVDHEPRVGTSAPVRWGGEPPAGHSQQRCFNQNMGCPDRKVEAPQTQFLVLMASSLLLHGFLVCIGPS